MAVTKIRGATQIMDNSIDLGRLVSPFLNGADWNMTNGANNQTITGLRQPTADRDAATKLYVDNLVNGVKWKPPVRVADFSGTLTLATDFSTGDTIDGVVLATGDLVLLGDAYGSQSGVYVVGPGAPSRAPGWNGGQSAANNCIFVQEGATYADKAYVVSNDVGSDVINADSLVFVQFSGSVTLPTHVYNDMVAATNGSPTINLSNTNLVSGTERVYLNGVRQHEGASNDYTIDYSTGVITFTYNLQTNDVVTADYQL